MKKQNQLFTALLLWAHQGTASGELPLLPRREEREFVRAPGAMAGCALLLTWLAGSLAQGATPGAVATWGTTCDFLSPTVPAAVQSGVIAIATGRDQTVALKADGTVLAWDVYSVNPTNLMSIPAAAQSGVTAIAASADHIVVLKTDGSVVEWGHYGWGQTNVPAGQSGVTAIAAGNGYTVALKTDGSVVTWDRIGEMLTVPVEAQSGVTAIAAASESQETMALKANGSVVAWSREDVDCGWGQMIVSPLAFTLSNIVAVSVGDTFEALKDDGTVLEWTVWDGAASVRIPAQSGVTAIAACDSQTVVLKSDGSVASWGYWIEPVPAGLSGVTAIAAGGGTGHRHAVAIYTPASPTIVSQPVGQSVSPWQSVSLSVKTVGYPVSYQWRKDGVNVPGATNATYSLQFAQPNHTGAYTVVASSYLGSVTSAPAVLDVSEAISPGTVVAWGIYKDVPIAAQSGVSAIAAGGEHTLALKNDGSVLAWGYNSAGQTDVPSAAQRDVLAIAAGFRHSVALKSDGSVLAWGAGINNQGNELSLGQSIVPTAAQSGVSTIAAGLAHTLALKHDGSVLAWGNNNDGQTDVPPAAQRDVVAIAAGAAHSLALKQDGSVLAWGAGTNIQVWTSHQGQSIVPTAAMSGVTAIAAGTAHSVALKNDGSVLAWGGNFYGQTDVPVAAQSGVIAIAAGAKHTLALKNDGTVVAWGDNFFGKVTGTLTEWPFCFVTANPVTLEGSVLRGVTAISGAEHHTVALLGTAPLVPWLNAKPNGNQLILSWPTNFVGFTLQSTPSLIPPVTWNDLSDAPVLIDGKCTVTNSLLGSPQFYRLRRP